MMSFPLKSNIVGPDETAPTGVCLHQFALHISLCQLRQITTPCFIKELRQHMVNIKTGFNCKTHSNFYRRNFILYLGLDNVRVRVAMCSMQDRPLVNIRRSQIAIVECLVFTIMQIVTCTMFA